MVLLFTGNIYKSIFLFLARSAWSRAKKPVVEISDLNREESMDYLVNKRGIKIVKGDKIDTTEAEKFVRISWWTHCRFEGCGR